MRRSGHMVIGLVITLAAIAPVAHSAARVHVRAGGVMPDDQAAAILRANGFPADRAVRALQDACFEQGRLFARIVVSVAEDSSYAVRVDPGPPAHVRHSRIAGASFMSTDEVRRALDLETGHPFVPGRLTQRVHDLLGGYDRAGYPFAQVWVDSVGVDADSAAVDISLFVVEGTTRVISSVVVEGLQKTRPALAARIAGIQPGTPYRARVLEDAFLRLTASGVFTHVEFPTVRLSADGKGVDAVVHVSEPARAHSFAAALGYASAEAGHKRTLSGLVQLDLNNIGGTLRDLGIMWTSDGLGRNETHLQYRDRFFLGHPYTLGARLEQTGLDTLYTSQSAGLDVSRAVGRTGGVLVGASLGGYGDRNVYSTGSLVHSTRWRVRVGASALGGSERGQAYARLDAAVTFAFKRTAFRAPAQGPPDVRQTIYESALEAVVPATRSLHYALDAHVQWLSSAEQSVPLPEQFYLGGARTVRGYRENQFHGPRVAWARNELRLGRSAFEGFYLFADAGYVRQQADLEGGGVSVHDRGLTGYGFGVRSASPVGRIDLSFAVSNGLSLQQTKVHVLLEQNF